MTTETGWAITGNFGFYYGSFFRTRQEAIEDHVRALYTYPQQPTVSNRKRFWRCRRKAGDRVVKVRILEIERRGAVG